MTDGIRTTADEFAEALALMTEENHAEALPLLARVVSFDSTNESAYVLWVDCHVSVGRMEKAIALADEGVARGIRPTVLNAQKSAALLDLKRFDEAAAAAQEALDIDPGNSMAILTLAGAEAARGRFDVAMDVCRNALAADDNGDIHFELMELARDTGRHDLAIRTARDYLRIFGKDCEVLTLLGNSYIALDDCRRADKAFRDAAALEPDVAEHHVNVLLVAMVTENDAVFHSYFDRLAARDVNLAREVLEETKTVINKFAENPVDESG